MSEPAVALLPGQPAASVSSAAIARAVAVLRAGGVVCIPTETTYGLAVDAQDRPALARLTHLKQGRDAGSPFALIAADPGSARTVAGAWPDVAEKLAKRHWPGPLTLVVPARSGLPAEIVGPPAMDGWAPFSGGVGVRVSSHPVPVALARGLGRPITATSANPSGEPPALDVTQARAYFGDAVVYLDAGAAPARSASTVVAVAADGRALVLRPGPIDVSQELAPRL